MSTDVRVPGHAVRSATTMLMSHHVRERLNSPCSPSLVLVGRRDRGARKGAHVNPSRARCVAEG